MGSIPGKGNFLIKTMLWYTIPNQRLTLWNVISQIKSTLNDNHTKYESFQIMLTKLMWWFNKVHYHVIALRAGSRREIQENTTWSTSGDRLNSCMSSEHLKWDGPGV